MLKVEDWAEIRRLHFAEGLGKQTIAKRLDISRNTVKAALARNEPPSYRRERRASAVDDYECCICALLKDCPTMPATVIAERIGWRRGMTILKQRIAQLRPLYLEPDPFQRTIYRPGELAQWDLWFPAADVPVGYGHHARLPVIVGVAGYSRVIVGTMIPSRRAADLLLGHWACLNQLGAVPRKGIYDNEAAIGTKRRDGTFFTHEFLAFKGALGMGAVILEKGHPERKGVVERAIGYLETSFLPGRSFEHPEDFNRQLASWLSGANARIHKGIRCRPIDRLAEDLGAMMPLPPIAPDVRHRFPRASGVTITCASTPVTIPFIRGRSDAASRSPPTSSSSLPPARAQRSPATVAASLHTARSPRSITPERVVSFGNRLDANNRLWTSTSNSAISPPMTKRWESHRWRAKRERTSRICVANSRRRRCSRLSIASPRGRATSHGTTRSFSPRV